MSLWVVVAAMTALTAALLASPLVRYRGFPAPQAAAPQAAAPDLAVYRAQLAELEHDPSTGPISGAVTAAISLRPSAPSSTATRKAPSKT